MITAQAKSSGADFIVMGAHGRHGIKRVAMGSFAEGVLHDIEMPVLLVHHGSTITPPARAAEALGFSVLLEDPRPPPAD